MIRALIIALAIAVIASPAEAKRVKKRVDPNGNPTVQRCDPPKRWIEVDALADDAGRRSKVVCKA